MRGTATRIEGAFAPVPTPVDLDGNLELGSLARHLEWLAGHGLDGAVVLGTNGEYPSFTLDERRRIAASAAAAGSGLRLILGVGSCALGDVLAMVGEAASLGYEAVLCPPPFYFRQPPLSGLVEFFVRVLDASTLPVLLYHIPRLTGVPLDDGLLDQISDHERVAGVKDSTGDPSEMRRLVARFRHASYLVGTDRLVLESRTAGGSGSITAAASVVPGLAARAAFDIGAQRLLAHVRELLEEFGLAAAVKAVLRSRGLGTYGSRPPLVGLEGDRQRSDELIRRFDEVSGERAPRA